MNAGKFIIMCCEYATFHQALRNKECFDAVDLFLSQIKTYSNFYKWCLVVNITLQNVCDGLLHTYNIFLITFLDFQ